MQHNLPTSSSRLDFITALRGIAAFAVLFSHIGERLSPAFHEFVITDFDPGNFGVILFFLSSGFVIPISLERENSLLRFWIKRVFRLYPLYWFTIVISLILAYISRPDQTIMALLSRNTTVILGNMTMIQLFLGIPYIRAEYWTLMLEMLFYFLISLLFIVKLHKKAEIVTYTMG